MSEADNCDDQNSDKDSNVCRDFLRNVCRRGKHCKYRHPDPTEAKEMGRKVEYVFCHDFQNNECHRTNCKFIHCSRADEEYYQECGELPPMMNSNCGGGVDGGGMGIGNNRAPLCKDFQKGECHRGSRCKFRHVDEYDMDMGYGHNAFGGMGVGGYGGGGGPPPPPPDSFDYYGGPDRKRRMFGNTDDFGGGAMPPPPPPASRPSDPPPLNADYYILEEENTFLRRKVEELKKQVADLTATNEFLLDQNAQLRVGKQAAGGVVPQSAMAPNRGVAAAQMAGADLAGAGSGTAQAIVPVSLAQGAALAPVSIAPVSITQAIPAAASLPHNPLISYPIVTQNMRPALAPGGMAR